RPGRGTRRVCERHKRLLTEQWPSSTHANTLRDVQSSQPRAALVDEPRPSYAITLGLQGRLLARGRSSHAPRLVSAGAWAAAHSVVRYLQRCWEGEASDHSVCACCSRISWGVGPSRYPQGAHCEYVMPWSHWRAPHWRQGCRVALYPAHRIALRLHPSTLSPYY